MKNILNIAFLLVAVLTSSCKPLKEVTGLKVAPETATIEVGQQLDLKAKLNPEGVECPIEWYSMKPQVAMVDENGKVTGISTGNVNVVAKASGFRAGCILTVVPATIHVTGIALSSYDLSIEVGKTSTITATVSPEDATTKTIYWTSSDIDIAIVDDGEITTYRVGEVDITATTKDGGFSATCHVTVKVPDIRVTGVSLDRTSATLWTDEILQLIPTVVPANATNQNVTWKSSSEAVAKVSSTGLVTGVGEGECDIEVKTSDGGFTAQCHITVKKGSTEVQGVSLAEKNLKMYVGASGTLTASVYPATALNKNVSWSSDKTDVVSVDNNGMVTAKSNGKAVITVTTEEGGFTDTCDIVVESYGSGSEGYHFGSFTWE